MSKKKTKLPKRIAGFKIPRKLRKNSKPLIKLLQTPQVQALMGAAFAAAAAALAEQKQDGMPGKWTAKKARRRFKFLAAEGSDRASEMAESVGRAVAGAIAPYLPEKRPEAEKAATAH